MSEVRKSKKPTIRRDKEGNLIVKKTKADGTIEEQVIKPGEVGIVELPEPEDTRPDQPDVAEGDIDYAVLAAGLLSPSAEANGVQVFDGKGEMTIADFGCSTAADISTLIHYIEANDLRQTSPWAIAYTLYRCLTDYAEGHP